MRRLVAETHNETVSETKLVRFPAAQSTLFEPWEVVETVRLGERPS